MLVHTVFCQVKVTGKVTSPDGALLSDASIVEKKSNNGVVTNTGGNYEITVAGKNSGLVISYTGFATQEVTVGDRNQVDISLATVSNKLDEVVVVGYGSQKKEILQER